MSSRVQVPQGPPRVERRATRVPDKDWPQLVDERAGWLWLRPPPGAVRLAGWALLPLRLFLGATFVFAGFQKLANPGFFDVADPASIQAQLAGAARRSPISGILVHLTHDAVALGVLIALGEIAVGLGTLLGLWARPAAVGGALISFSLFLAVSFHSSPYYTGSDIVFAFAWLPIVVAGTGGVLSLDGFIRAASHYRARVAPEAVVPVPFTVVRDVCGSFDKGTCAARRAAVCEPGPCPYLRRKVAVAPRAVGARIDRRTFTTSGAAAAALAGAGLVVAGITAAVGRAVAGPPPGRTRSLAPGRLQPSGTTTTAPTRASGTTTAPRRADGDTTTTRGATTRPAAGRRAAGTDVGPARDVPVGGAARFTDPASGDPSLVIQPEAGTFLAFDAVCPHAGCIVGYRSPDFVCPCHGSVFSGTDGAVQSGPAPTGLRQLQVAEGPDGQLYVV